MAKRKSGKRRPVNSDGRRRSRRGRTSQQGWGEQPFVREYADAAGKSMDRVPEYADDYSDMLDEIATLTRRNVAATFSLGIAAGLFTAQLARQWTSRVRKH
jgi:hypothetical protein